MYGPGDVRVVDRDEPRIVEPTDAVIRLTATCICGSDLWPYRGAEPAYGLPMGHEYAGVVEEVGSAVETVRPGDFVIGSFVISDGTCDICRAGYPSRCVHAEFVHGTIGTQSERARIPCFRDVVDEPEQVQPRLAGDPLEPPDEDPLVDLARLVAPVRARVEPPLAVPVDDRDRHEQQLVSRPGLGGDVERG